MAELNEERLPPSGSKGQMADMGFSSIGFSAPSSGAGTSESILPPSSLAVPAIK